MGTENMNKKFMTIQVIFVPTIEKLDRPFKGKPDKAKEKTVPVIVFSRKSYNPTFYENF